MTWEQIGVLIAGIIGAVGSSGAIIVAITKWGGNILAEKMLKKQQLKYDKQFEEVKTKYQKEIEKYKNELDIDLEKNRSINTGMIYVTEKQFDIEIMLLQELTEKAFELEMQAKMLFPMYDDVPKDLKLQGELKNKRFTDYVNACNNFISILGKSRAFINNDIYNRYIEFYQICNKQCFFYKYVLFNGATLNHDEENQCYKRSEEIVSINLKACDLVKKYLNKLKIINGEK